MTTSGRVSLDRITSWSHINNLVFVSMAMSALLQAMMSDLLAFKVTYIPFWLAVLSKVKGHNHIPEARGHNLISAP